MLADAIIHLLRCCVTCGISLCLLQNSKFDGADFSNGIIDRVSFDGSSMKGAIFTVSCNQNLHLFLYLCVELIDEL
jgi:uncharacterized protein YjbI with pentapeptide repeats